MTEQEIRNNYIRPAIEKAGWEGKKQIREEYSLTAGRVVVRGQGASRDNDTVRRADYVLEYRRNVPLAVVEAKDNRHPVEAGIQQALDYARRIGVPFAFSSNGDGFLFHDGTAGAASGESLETRLGLGEFPSPEALWEKYRAWKRIPKESEDLVLWNYHATAGGRDPRYYQVLAINRSLEAVATGKKRILLVMATGTGKTYTAFQIIWRLWKSGRAKRILYLADRNILIDQTMVNDFKPFKGAMAKLSPDQKGLERIDAAAKAEMAAERPGEVIYSKAVDTSYEIYLSLYQAVSGTEESQNVYKQLKPDFFDLVVVDECHRGSAAEESAWRSILDHFSGAVHLGLTATPNKAEGASNVEYFGKPVYEYSLKQGIEDGYLAPYKVIRATLDKDLGWRPESGMRDDTGAEIEDREYNQKDMNKALVLRKRDLAVARRVTRFLKENGRFSKTIVFCEDIDHAGRMRVALANENADLARANPKYVMKITGDDPEGKAELDNFIDPEQAYPVIACTSRLMSTGVDARTCKLVVLDRTINSMTEFKQIIGRGTRIDEEYGKLFFTILDFKQATKLFADPDFDGPPESDEEEALSEEGESLPGGGPGPADGAEGPRGGAAGAAGEEGEQGPAGRGPGPQEGEGGPGEPSPDPGGDRGAEAPDPPSPRIKYLVSGVEVAIVNEMVQYLDASGKLMVESIVDFSKRNFLRYYPVRSAFVEKWKAADRKRLVLEEIERAGISIELLEEKFGADCDPFDLLCHVAYGSRVLTRAERAEKARRDLHLRDAYTKYSARAKAVIEALLDKYAIGGIDSLEDPAILKVSPFPEIGSILEIYQSLGGPDGFDKAVEALEASLYDIA
ncbi:MAG TPA: DEAD/DEAH box helicase family protein [Spirochaetales bacterium]|nr:DEAD/DEAH box helicase family protein [Spirochaetales bacterium]